MIQLSAVETAEIDEAMQSALTELEDLGFESESASQLSAALQMLRSKNP